MPKTKQSFSVIILLFMMSMDFSANAAEPSKTTKKSSYSAVTQFAANAGVKTCLSSMEKVNAFVLNKNQAGAFVFVAPKEANQKMVSTSLEVYSATNKDALPLYASTYVEPITSNTCMMSYETVTYYPISCENAAKQKYAKFKSDGVLAKSIHVLKREANVTNQRTYLMPAGSGCVVINKEVVF